MHQSAVKFYDIRGVVGTDFVESDTYFFVRALLEWLQKNQNKHIQRIVVGYDNRSTSQSIKQFVLQACTDFGAREIMCDNIPTPVLQFGMYRGYADVGIMITASHNPLSYNGLKIWCGAQAVQGHMLQQVWQYMQTQTYIMSDVQSLVKEATGITDAYYAQLDALFYALRDASFSIVFMASGGPLQKILKRYKYIFNWQFVDIVGCTDDQSCTQFSPDPTSADTQAFVHTLLAQKSYDCVLAFDGDADRFVVYAADGTLLTGDQVGYLFARQNEYKHIVMDIKTSGGLVHALTEQGVQVTLAPTGCAAIKTEIKKQKASFGCEVSGHYFFEHHEFIDDGLFAALQFLQNAHVAGSVQAVCDDVPVLHDSVELRLPLHHTFDPDVVKKYIECDVFPQNGGTLFFVDGIRYQTECGWFIMRASKTEPVLSLRYGVFDVHYTAVWTELVKKSIQFFIAQAVIEQYEW